jgi:arylsulfatase A-like enzyme
MLLSCDVLDERDFWEKIIVVFLGDHGYHHDERGWWNKNTLFERSARAPLLTAAPGMKVGQSTQRLVEFIDILPTLADLYDHRTDPEEQHNLASQKPEMVAELKAKLRQIPSLPGSNAD